MQIRNKNKGLIIYTDIYKANLKKNHLKEHRSLN